MTKEPITNERLSLIERAGCCYCKELLAEIRRLRACFLAGQPVYKTNEIGNTWYSYIPEDGKLPSKLTKQIAVLVNIEEVNK